MPICPDPIPSEISDAARALALAYWHSPTRPRLPDDVVKHWDSLIDRWAEDASMPLFIRKQRDHIGDLLVHGATGRTLAPCDNSPAHWAIVSAFAYGCQATLEHIRADIAAHRISVTMVFNKAEFASVAVPASLKNNPMFNASEYGWKVDHIDDVGLKSRGRIEMRPIEELKEHFRRLMKPSNIVLVPSALKGLGDLPEFLALARQERDLPIRSNTGGELADRS